MIEDWTPWATHPPIGEYIEVEDSSGKLFYGRWHSEMGFTWVGKSENDLRWPVEIVRWRLADEQDC